MRFVGLTGGMGSGKTSVAKLLEEMGAMILDADELARAVVQPGQRALTEIFETFGPEYRTKEGELDRKKLADLVFADKVKLAKLNEITHKEIHKLRSERIREFYRNHPEGLLIYMVPLLFETKMQGMFQRVILVCLEEELQIERLTRYRGFSKEEASARLSHQLSQSAKEPLADHLIDNSKSLNDTKAQLAELMPRLEELEQWSLERILNQA